VCGYGDRMPRQPRHEIPGGYYHVTAHGNGDTRIFVDDDDYAFFLSFLGRIVKRHDWQCFAYALLPTHYHLVLRIDDADLSQGMRSLNGLYAQTHNGRHGRSGHLFGGRYRTGLIESDDHLAKACRYVDLNPLRAGLCNHPRDWPWSSYPALVDEVPAPPFLSLDLVSEFGGGEAYGAYVDEGLAAIREEREQQSEHVFAGG
jgi:putative transposase